MTTYLKTPPPSVNQNNSDVINIKYEQNYEGLSNLKANSLAKKCTNNSAEILVLIVGTIVLFIVLITYCIIYMRRLALQRRYQEQTKQQLRQQLQQQQQLKV